MKKLLLVLVLSLFTFSCQTERFKADHEIIQQAIFTEIDNQINDLIINKELWQKGVYSPPEDATLLCRVWYNGNLMTIYADDDHFRVIISDTNSFGYTSLYTTDSLDWVIDTCNRNDAF